MGSHPGQYLKHYRKIKKFYRKLLNKERLYNLHHADGEEAEIGGKAKALARTVTYKHIEVLSVEDEMSLREKLKGTGIDERRLPGIIARMPLSAKMAYRERKGDFTLLSCPRTVLVEVIPDDKSPHGKMFLWKKKLQENLGYRYINPDGSEGGWVSVFCSLHQNGKEIFIDKESKVFGKCVLEGGGFPGECHFAWEYPSKRFVAFHSGSRRLHIQ